MSVPAASGPRAIDENAADTAVRICAAIAAARATADTLHKLSEPEEG